jgi:plastocyanin
VIGEDDSPADYEYLIPYGTQRRIASGEKIEIMPERLEVEVGESIRITNEDNKGAFVGIFYVGAGETVRMKFTTPGELSGKCEVSSSGEFTIAVQEA